MQCQAIVALQGDGEIAVLHVGEGDAKKQLFARKPNARISADSPMLWRRTGKDKGRYEISTLDLANVGFKEVRFDAYSELQQLLKVIHAEKLGAAIEVFEHRMATLKSELLSIVPSKEFGAKIDVLIHRYHQMVLDHGDPKKLEMIASAALKKCLEREVDILDKARNSLELHSALVEEGAKITNEFSVAGVDLKGVLRGARKRAISTGLSIEAGKALMRASAQQSLAAKSSSAQRNHAKDLLEAFLGELLASNNLGDKGRYLLEGALQKALQKDHSNVDLIKDMLSSLARQFLEDSAKQVVWKQEALRQAQENVRVRVLKNQRKLAEKHRPTTNQKDEVARKLLASQASAVRNPVVKKRTDQPVLSSASRREDTQSASRRHPEPFNSAMADKLGWALALSKNDK